MKANAKFWIWLRRISQTLFFAFFSALILTATYPLNLPLPYDLAGKLSPLVALITSIADRTMYSGIWFALIVVIISVVFGRAFCGWVCPLGVVIDFNDWIIRKIPFIKRRKEANVPKHRYWRFVILIGIFIFALFGIQLAGYFDPMSIFPRSVGVGIYPLIVSIFSEVTSRLYFADVLPDTMIWLRSNVRPHEADVLSYDLSFLIVFSVILLFGFIRPRFYCRYLCPTGALISIFGWMSPFSRDAGAECVSCQLCLRDCRTGAMTDKGAGTKMSECILCMDCLDSCRTGCNSFGFKRKRGEANLTSWAPSLSRRTFLISSGVGIATAVPAAIAIGKEKEIGSVIRPPGSLPESAFLDKCIRCGECIRVCLTGGLVPAMLEAGVEGIWTPRFNMFKGYCEYHCVLCTQVCPTGAIEPLVEEVKLRTIIGYAKIDRDKCIPFVDKEECLVCEEFCPTSPKAIEIKYGRNRLRAGKPVVDIDLCVGCGICQYVCPVEGGAIFIYPSRGYATKLRSGTNDAPEPYDNPYGESADDPYQ